MNVQLRWENENQLLLTCSGEIGWDALDGMVRKVSEALADRSRPRVVIDLEMVDLITSAGLGGLLQVRKFIIERGGYLVLARPCPQIAQLIRTVGLDRHVPLTDTLDMARSLLAQVG